MTNRDGIYRDPQSQLVDFSFDRSVAEVFQDMIRRSVPAYEAVVPLTALLAARHLSGSRHGQFGSRQSAAVESPHGQFISRQSRESSARHSRIVGSGQRGGLSDGRRRLSTGAPQAGGGLVFDLGCSLGAGTLALLRQLGERPARIVAVDNSKPMLDRAAGLIDDERVEFRLEDLRDTDVAGADVILMNYALQFLPPGDRDGLMRRFRERMAPGGLLLLSEKIEFADAGDREYFDAAHLAFKRANGYSDLEVSRKRSALEKVMIVDTEDVHRARLRAAGFNPVRTWFRCLNWASFLAWA